MKKKMTILDIAKMANVSKSTVSRYFNGGYIKEEKRQLIEKIVLECDYTPNIFSRLKAKRSNLIGVIAPCLDSIATSRVLMGIDAHLIKEGIHSFIMNTNHDIELELKYLRELQQLNVDGIILSATILTQRHYDLIDELKVPVVVVGQAYKNASVIHDDYAAAQTLANHVIEKKYKDVLIIGIEKQDEALGVNRTNGLLDTFNQHKIDYHLEIADFSYDTSLLVLKRALFEHKPDLIVCLTTQQLLAAYHLMQELNYNIPNDIGICGFGGYEFVRVIKPNLTTIHFDYHLAGKKAAKMMMKILNDENVEIEKVNYSFYKGESA